MMLWGFFVKEQVVLVDRIGAAGDSWQKMVLQSSGLS
jgi:hypothetical protein